MQNHKVTLQYKLYILITAFLMVSSTVQAINRQALVARHNIIITKIDALSPLSLGNGRFAFTADVTGLQTFPDVYEKGIPLTTMAEWGWHSFPNLKKIKLQDTFVDVQTNGRKVPYNINHKCAAADWLRANPHQMTLSRIGFVLKKADGSAAVADDITNIHQELNLWTGLLTSFFELEGKKVLVKTVCHPTLDEIGFEVQSELITQNRLIVEIAFPYPADKWGNDPADWTVPQKHSTKLKELSHTQAQIIHNLDSLAYSCKIQFPAGTQIKQRQKHHYILRPPADKDKWDCSVAFSKKIKNLPITDFNTIVQKNIEHWKQFWTTGGAVDLSQSTDPRWKELERRIVLSQYLTAIQSAQKYPPQETGLTCTSWFGKFHLEMHWWHSVHFALWNRMALFAPSLEWYKTILPVARKIAKRQGYQGARWPKMVGPEGQDSPSSIGPLLIWQQPHPIYYAELCYRENSSTQVLEKYKDIVFETATFMASYASWNEDRNRFELGPPLVSAREFSVDTYEKNKNPAFELAYWRWGLLTANNWRKRLGMQPEPKWESIANQLASWPIQNGVYTEQEIPAVDDGSHPCMLGAFGILPASPQLDKKIMEKTLEHVLANWQWDDTWGWDFPMMAMTAARLGRGDLAIQSLLLNVKKNNYLPNGHNNQRENLPCYLPGNGGLLTAVAMMTAGWDGSPTKNAPGFPDDGKWIVQWENLKKMP
jgi:hypothetical protein